MLYEIDATGTGQAVRQGFHIGASYLNDSYVAQVASYTFRRYPCDAKPGGGIWTPADIDAVYHYIGGYLGTNVLRCTQATKGICYDGGVEAAAVGRSSAWMF